MTTSTLSKPRRQRNALLWEIPVAYGITVFVLLLSPLVDPELLLNHGALLFPFVIPACIVSPFGGFWAVYQCVRYERNLARYLAIVVLVPLGFTWYYFERYRFRCSDFDRLADWRA